MLLPKVPAGVFVVSTVAETESLLASFDRMCSVPTSLVPLKTLFTTSATATLTCPGTAGSEVVFAALALPLVGV